MEKKYIFTNETYNFNGHTLHRIKSLKSFCDVKEGDLGGWVEKEENLSHDGDCLVYNDAKVYGNAKVYGSANVEDEAMIYGNANIFGESLVYYKAKVDYEVSNNEEINI